MEFPSLDPNNNYIYIKFATLQSNALLMYNHDNQTGDKAEFLALEILEGRMRFSFNLGSGTYKLMTMIRVSDGHFHTVIARRAGMVSLCILYTHRELKCRVLVPCAFLKTIPMSTSVVLLDFLSQWALESQKESHTVRTKKKPCFCAHFYRETKKKKKTAIQIWPCDFLLRRWMVIKFQPSRNQLSSWFSFFVIIFQALM